MKKIAYDYLDIRADLSDTERMVQDSTRAFVKEEIQPLIADHFKKGTFPENIIPKLGAMGLLGSTLPKKYGGQEMSYTSYGLVCQELEFCDSSIRSFVSVQGSLVRKSSPPSLMASSCLSRSSSADR